MGVLTPNIVAKEALIVLENELVLGGLVHRAYSSEFKSVGSTVQVRVPTTLVAASVSSTVSMGTLSEGTVDVVLNQHQDVSLTITSKDLSLDIVDFREQVLMPAMRAHAQRIDSEIAGEYIQVAGHYAVDATPAVADVTGIRAVLNVQKAPMSQRRLVMHPMTEAAYLAKDAFLHAEKRGDTRAIKEASMGRVLGLDCYMDQNIKSFDHGSADAGTSTLLLCGAGASAATVATIDACANSSVVNAYDVFKVEGYDQWHVVSVNATSNGTVVVSFQPAFAVANTDNSTVTFVPAAGGNAYQNLCFHKNAFALVTAPLEPPLGGAKGTTLSYKGITCRVVYDYVFMEKFNMISLDMLFGVKTLDRELAARFIDAY